jgi:hypothetical protein
MEGGEIVHLSGRNAIPDETATQPPLAAGEGQLDPQHRRRDYAHRVIGGAEPAALPGASIVE